MTSRPGTTRDSNCPAKDQVDSYQSTRRRSQKVPMLALCLISTSSIPPNKEQVALTRVPVFQLVRAFLRHEPGCAANFLRMLKRSLVAASVALCTPIGLFRGSDLRQTWAATTRIRSQVVPGSRFSTDCVVSGTRQGGVVT